MNIALFTGALLDFIKIKKNENKEFVTEIMNKLKIIIREVLSIDNSADFIKELFKSGNFYKKNFKKKIPLIEFFICMHKFKIIENIDFINKNILDMDIINNDTEKYEYIFLFDANIRFIILFFIKYNLIEDCGQKRPDITEVLQIALDEITNI